MSVRSHPLRVGIVAGEASGDNLAAGLVRADQAFPELGAIVAGKSPGRVGPDDITIADLTGTGVQDTAIATLARQRAEAQSIGSVFRN